ncbi:MAG: hypothetical protein Q9166_007824 [cf. Caloplaca sp. 2 TL-2023]
MAPTQFNTAHAILMNRTSIRTGHVLVTDIDEQRDRDPWIILASEWETEANYPETFNPSVEIEENARGALGVFPGDDIRTTIARLTPYGWSENTDPPVLRFGPNFNFGLQELRIDTRPLVPMGPKLAEVMHWFKNPEGEEVCYDDNDQAYMKFDPQIGKYWNPLPGIPDAVACSPATPTPRN